MSCPSRRPGLAGPCPARQRKLASAARIADDVIALLAVVFAPVQHLPGNCKPFSSISPQRSLTGRVQRPRPSSAPTSAQLNGRSSARQAGGLRSTVSSPKPSTRSWPAQASPQRRFAPKPSRERLRRKIRAHRPDRGHRPDADLRRTTPAVGPGEVAQHCNGRRPHRGRQLHPPRPDHPVADISQEKIKRRDVLGGLISKYERAA